MCSVYNRECALCSQERMWQGCSLLLGSLGEMHSYSCHSYSCMKHKASLIFGWFKTNKRPGPGRRLELCKSQFIVTCWSRVAYGSFHYSPPHICLRRWGGSGAVEGPGTDVDFISLRRKPMQHFGFQWLLPPGPCLNHHEGREGLLATVSMSILNYISTLQMRKWKF